MSKDNPVKQVRTTNDGEATQRFGQFDQDWYGLATDSPRGNGLRAHRSSDRAGSRRESCGAGLRLLIVARAGDLPILAAMKWTILRSTMAAVVALSAWIAFPIQTGAGNGKEATAFELIKEGNRHVGED